MDQDRSETAANGDARRTIARLAVDTLPRLIERLMRSDLGELEVRDEGWRIRLRRPNGVDAGAGNVTTEPRDRGRHSGSPPASGHVERAGSHRSPAARRPEPDKGLVTSPAVGYFVAHDGVSVGARVRKGDVIGQVDVLGVSQEVVAPVDGSIGSFEVEPGQAIEFGQPVARVQTAESRASELTAHVEEEPLGQLVEA